MQKFKLIGKPLVWEKYAHGRRKRKKEYRVRQRGCSLTHSARTPLTLHPGMTICHSHWFPMLQRKWGCLAKRKRPEDEPAHPEDDWHDEVYSYTSSFVQFDKFGQRVIATFSKGPVSSVLKGGHIASNSNVLCKVKPLSCFDDISGSTEIVQAEEGLETTKTSVVEISGKL